MNRKPRKKRLDVLVVERGWADSRAKAQAMILAGEVTVDGKRSDKPGLTVGENAQIEARSRLQKFVSRGGFKLEGALEELHVPVEGRVCLDVGSSTGGFTDCLLQKRAQRVYAVDVNTDQLAWKLHKDPRVVRLKRNARELQPDDLPEPVEIVVIDVSFISVAKVLPGPSACAKAGADFVILVKPQFELERESIGPGGIVRDPQLHATAIQRVRDAVESLGLGFLEVTRSRLLGAEGNQEYFLHARKPPKVESQ